MIEGPKLAELKKELNFLQPAELKEACLRLAKHKTENKELLHYLLFYGDKTDEYAEKVKELLAEGFEELHPSIYKANKQLRKLLRTANKHIKFMASKHLEVEIALHFAQLFLAHPISRNNQKTTQSVLASQLKRIWRLVPKLEEDLSFDYQQQFEQLLAQIKKQKTPIYDLENFKLQPDFD